MSKALSCSLCPSRAPLRLSQLLVFLLLILLIFLRRPHLYSSRACWADWCSLPLLAIHPLSGSHGSSEILSLFCYQGHVSWCSARFEFPATTLAVDSILSFPLEIWILQARGATCSFARAFKADFLLILLKACGQTQIGSCKAGAVATITPFEHFRVRILVMRICKDFAHVRSVFNYIVRRRGPQLLLSTMAAESSNQPARRNLAPAIDSSQRR
jgi:hypothetical protein